LHCEQEEKKLADLRRKRMLEEAILQHHVSKDAEYIKLQSLLKKESLTETIRRNPERYVSPLPMISYNIINYSTCSYDQWQPTDYFDIQSNLIKDATKLFEKKLAKSLET
jgi:hypothetical protein